MQNISLPHIAVLQDEVVDTFSKVDNGYIVDCTVGYGTHSKLLLDTLPNIKMICVDQDEDALKFCKNRLESYKDRVVFVKSNFANIDDVFKKYDIRGILADIGVSSLQLDNQDRGFGFECDTLDMRMDKGSKISAFDVVNYYSKEDLEKILLEYGDVRAYKKVAHLICEERKNKNISSNIELSNLLYRNMKAMKKGMHPATLVFQAIRIEVNKELDVLKSLLENIQNANLKNTIISIISFHSLEDKIVKTYFKNWSKACICPSDAMKCTCGKNNQYGKIITKKPLIPNQNEIKQNPRSRSSKMRVFHILKNA